VSAALLLVLGASAMPTALAAYGLGASARDLGLAAVGVWAAVVMIVAVCGPVLLTIAGIVSLWTRNGR
jgi:hypothetical protein